MSNFLKFRGLRARLRETNRRLFTKYLLITNLTISTTFSGLGDYLEQVLEITAGYKNDWDRLRTLKLASTGLPVGLVCHYWFIFLDRKITGRTGKFLIKKILLDQLIGSPLYIIAFFITIGFWDSWSKKFKEELFSKATDIYIAEWIRPPIQAINFYILPTKYRLLYDSIVSLGFDMYTSYVTHKGIFGIKSTKNENKIEVKK